MHLLQTNRNTPCEKQLAKPKLYKQTGSQRSAKARCSASKGKGDKGCIPLIQSLVKAVIIQWAQWYEELATKPVVK